MNQIWGTRLLNHRQDAGHPKVEFKIHIDGWLGDYKINFLPRNQRLDLFKVKRGGGYQMKLVLWQGRLKILNCRLPLLFGDLLTMDGHNQDIDLLGKRTCWRKQQPHQSQQRIGTKVGRLASHCFACGTMHKEENRQTTFLKRRRFAGCF